jgi:hypothetical protein
MAITMDSPILQVLATHPKSIEVFRKYGMGQIEDPQVQAMAAGASLETAAGFVGLTSQQRESFLSELQQLAQA